MVKPEMRKTIKLLTKENLSFETLGKVSSDMIKNISKKDADIRGIMTDFGNILGDTGLSFNYLFDTDSVNIFGSVEGNMLDYTRDSNQEMIEIYNPERKTLILKCLYDITTHQSISHLNVKLPLKGTDTEDMFMLSRSSIRDMLKRIPSLVKTFRTMGGKINEREVYMQSEQFLLSGGTQGIVVDEKRKRRRR